MPLAVTHVLVPLISTELLRDSSKSARKWLSRRMVFIAGIAGLVLDSDVVLYNLLLFLGRDIGGHRVLFHNIWIPLSFLGFFALFYYGGKKESQKTFGKIFLMLFLGTSMHLILDAVLTGEVMPFFPLDTTSVDLNLIQYLPIPHLTTLVSLDAVLLIYWLWHEEMHQKIKDYF